MQQALDIRDFEIERRLDAYARARLSPDPAAVARTRARVMREARLQFEAARIAAHVVPAVSLATHRPLARRIATPLLAASLWAGVVVGSVAAAQAGGPLYPTRMWIETATLPATGVARTTAELDRLDARLGDALGAAARGDAGAAAAALAAYRQIADETIVASTGDAALEAKVAAALEGHLAVLTAVSASLEAKGNSTAADAVETAIERTIERNAAVVAGLAGNGGGKGSGSGSTDGAGATGGGKTGGGGQSGNGQTGGTGSTGGNGGAGSGQDGGAKPTREPKPTAAPEATPSVPSVPDHTPRGQNQ